MMKAFYYFKGEEKMKISAHVLESTEAIKK